MIVEKRETYQRQATNENKRNDDDFVGYHTTRTINRKYYIPRYKHEYLRYDKQYL